MVVSVKPETYAKVKEDLLSFARSTVKAPYSVEELKRAYPFHSLFFSDEALKAFKKQRTIVTRMGQKLIPQLAERIARDRYRDVRRNHTIVGRVDIAKINVIDRIVSELRMGRRKPNHQRELQEILNAKSDEIREVQVIADLFIGDFKPGPLLLEIKSPLPNLDICAESKRKMLLFKAIFENRNPQAYLAFYYNPYFPKKYRYPFTMRIMDLDSEVLIGKAMWDLLGGEGTYYELLNIIEEVRRELGAKT